MAIPQDIQREHILQAMEALDSGAEIDSNPSSRNVVLYEGRIYSPKTLIRIASELATGQRVENFSGGHSPSQATGFIKGLGFEVGDKLRQWEAAYWVLKDKEPRKSQEIAQLLVQDPLVSTEGIKPEDSVYTVMLGRSENYDGPAGNKGPRHFRREDGNQWFLSGWGKDNPPKHGPNRPVNSDPKPNDATNGEGELPLWMAAYWILHENEPLSTHEIWKLILERKWNCSNAENPAGALYRTMLNHEENHTGSYGTKGKRHFRREDGNRWFLSEWGRANPPKQQPPEWKGSLVEAVAAVEKPIPPFEPEDVLEAGAFLELDEVERILRRLRTKKNLILQGPPGTGKSFLARLLAFALIGRKDPSCIEAVQFHPSTSYEDFVRGYRPTSTAGAFELKDGPFLKACERARQRPDSIQVLLIDEINRANLSQVFGELFLLLEGDKRNPEYAVTPLYTRSDGEKLFIPPNLYVIGTMNIADRSLALVDFALRRRFAYVTLGPRFDKPRFEQWLRDRNMPSSLVSRIIQRMQSLNEDIENDTTLGAAFQVGHSFFCPADEDCSQLGDEWYREVIETEIGPLLEEYWYDNLSRAKAARESLLE